MRHPSFVASDCALLKTPSSRVMPQALAEQQQMRAPARQTTPTRKDAAEGAQARHRLPADMKRCYAAEAAL